MKPWRKVGCLAVLLLVCAIGCAGPMITVLSSASTIASNSSLGEDIGGSAPGIGDRMLTAYKNAVTGVADVVPKCRGMRWPILAGIARIESNHAAGHSVSQGGDITPRILGPVLNGSGVGGNVTAFPDTDDGKWDGDTVYERAVGPFQFLPATFRSYGRDANGDGAVNPHNADDAALAAAVYLCGNNRNLGDESQLKKAIYAYNHSDAYVADVLSWIHRYDAAAQNPGEIGQATGKARTVLAAALSQRGVPYSWGGGKPKGKSTGICCSPSGQDGRRVNGFDCSGLTLYAFAQVGVTLPHRADLQAGYGTRIPASAGFGALKPGDLVFYGSPTADSTIHHVGIYLGNGQMINAAKPGTNVRVDSLTSMADYAGGARIL
ncbi:NlpC/P60 family protein (plasmid) [Streptomyces sp. NBC_01724]|uniref:C40 family peptidase n=1 Tax=Streptomyces sp. NBC_01724 TaxID=2975922 RepID=UPI002E36036C|nr:bifunctional lytic transglycosylase/C40 family peptidase [Streptomyces sp. NBC_01724]